MRRRGGRSRGLFRLIVAGLRRIHFLQLISKVTDLPLKNFQMFFHFII
jgi:hypothetical protein